MADQYTFTDPTARYADIETKLATLADRAKFPRDVRPLIDAVWALEDTADAGDVARLASLED